VSFAAALGGLASAPASAALPEFLPALTESFTSKAGASTLETGGQPAIACTAAKTSNEKGTGVIELTGCSVFGIIGAHSLGDKEGIILIKAEGTICYISKSKKEVGDVTHISTTHIEVAGKLLQLTGTAIGKMTPVNTKTKTLTISFKEKEGKQEFTKCEGGSEEVLSVSENEGTSKAAGLAQSYEDMFSTEEELMA
jgi:hypothetical protein